MPVKRVILGCGVLGGQVARAWAREYPGDELVCTVREPGSAGRLEGLKAELGAELAVEVVPVDLLSGEAPALLSPVCAGAQTVLCSIAPGPGSPPVGSVAARLLTGALDSGARLIWISSTGVYEENGGAEVDESAPLSTSPRARDLVEAEGLLAAGGNRLRVTVLRCSGLVGTARGPQRVLERYAGTRRDDGEGWLSLVWIDDVVAVVMRAAGTGIDGTFNLSGPPLRRREFLDPLLSRAGLDPVVWEGGKHCGRRINCDQLAREFGFRPRPVLPGDLVGD